MLDVWLMPAASVPKRAPQRWRLRLRRLREALLTSATAHFRDQESTMLSGSRRLGKRGPHVSAWISKGDFQTEDGHVEDWTLAVDKEYEQRGKEDQVQVDPQHGWTAGSEASGDGSYPEVAPETSPPSTLEGPHPSVSDSSHESFDEADGSDHAEEAANGPDLAGVDNNS